MSKATVSRRHNPLAEDISTSGGRLRTKSITGKRKSRSGENENGDGYVDALSSRKILAIAQDLADEDAEERRATAKAAAPNAAFAIDSRFTAEEDEGAEYRDEEEEWLPDEDVAEEDLDPEDLAVYSKFLPEGDELADFTPSMANLSTDGKKSRTAAPEPSVLEEGETTNLADLILQRIAEKEAFDASRANLNHSEPVSAPPDSFDIPPKVIDTFQKCGQILSRYKSGPLPKPFKVLPSLPQWPDLLALTRPESWTPNAVYAATKIFKSSTTAISQHFIELVLLDRVREDIHETKKLNVHLYNALRDTLYHPAAFFRGFLFPLVEGACTLREAHIISSIVAKKKINALHCAAALLRLCEIAAEQSSLNSESAGAANVFIRVILEKRYALPFKAVDAVVFHFLRFRGSRSSKAPTAALAAKEPKLPVLWHQAFLAFAERYMNDITEDQREALLDLLLVRGHRDMGPEIRRQLLAGRNRGVAAPVVAEREDGDDTMDLGA